MPSGLARSSRAPAERKPAAAAPFAASLRNSLLEIADIDASLLADILLRGCATPEPVKSAALRLHVLAKVPTLFDVPGGRSSVRERS